MSSNWRRENSTMLIPLTRSSVGRTPYRAGAVVLIALLWRPCDVRADDSDPTPSFFSLHGFGTLGVVHSDAREVDFVVVHSSPTAPGIIRRGHPEWTARWGFRWARQFTQQLSAIVQVVSQHIYDNTWRPQIEWANLQYQLTPDFSIRAGRSVAAPFLVSDTSLVGYTYPWVRPPPELYWELPVSNQDGARCQLSSAHQRRGAIVERQLRPIGLESYGRWRGGGQKVPPGQRCGRGEFIHVQNGLHVAPRHDRYSGPGSAIRWG